MLREAEPTIPDELGDRAADVWEPLLAIADDAGGPWPERARRAAAVLAGKQATDDDSVGVQLLFDIRATFDDLGHEEIPSRNLVDGLARIEESPWAELDGRRLTAARLAGLLRAFEIRPQHWREGARTVRGYRRSDFEDAFRRYLPTQQPEDRHSRHGDAGDRGEPPSEAARVSGVCRPEDPAAPLPETPVTPVPPQTDEHEPDHPNTTDTPG